MVYLFVCVNHCKLCFYLFQFHFPDNLKVVIYAIKLYPGSPPSELWLGYCKGELIYVLSPNICP